MAIQKKIPDLISDDTLVEVVCTKKNEVFKKIIPFGEAKKIKPKTGWKCLNYQIGFSQFNEKKS